MAYLQNSVVSPVPQTRTFILLVYIILVDMVVAYVVKTCVVLAYIVMSYTVMACEASKHRNVCRP